jgi:hypothetical protein
MDIRCVEAIWRDIKRKKKKEREDVTASQLEHGANVRL